MYAIEPQRLSPQTGAFRRPLRWLLLSGIALLLGLPGPTSLQAQNLTEELRQVPLEVLADQARRFGDPARGAMAFALPTMNCTRCHARSASGRRLGPDLTEKREVTWAHLAQSILEPSAQIKEGFESVQVLLLDGRVVSGILVSQDDQALVLDQIEQPEKPLRLASDDIEEWATTRNSSMPEGLASQLASRQQFLDLVSYLAALAEGGPEVADRLQPNAIAEIPLPEYEARVDHAGLIRQWNGDALRRGAETFRLRCASCHGTLEEEGSMPTSLRFASGTFKRGSDPLSMYQTLTHGFGMMNPQRWMVPQQKYEVIHYIREHFLRAHNPTQYTAVDEAYLASLPPGDTPGPAPATEQPWTMMDYGPSLNNTIEVSSDGSNIAQKGIVIRLDDGPGGVESGQHWMLYEHDTLRLAAAWSGAFIDYEGIHFNGAHNRHPRVAGQVHVANATGPGFARPQDPDQTLSLDERFADDRVVGRDGRHYGPLPAEWGRFEGLYRYGRQTVLKYRVGATEVLEWPALRFAGQQPMYTRTLNLGAREQDLVLQVADVQGQARIEGTVVQVLPPQAEESPGEPTVGLRLDGTTGFQAPGEVLQMGPAQFTLAARLKTRQDGTLLAKTLDQAQWVPQGKSLFLRGGRPTLDVGWVGAVRANRRVDDGQWHDVVVRWDQGQVDFLIDGQPAGSGELLPAKPLPGGVLRIGMTNENFPATTCFQGELAFLRCYQRRLENEELANLDQADAVGLVAQWDGLTGNQAVDRSGATQVAAKRLGNGPASAAGVLATVSGLPGASWSYADGKLRLTLPAGPPAQVLISQGSLQAPAAVDVLQAVTSWQARDLKPMTSGGPPLYPQELTSDLIPGKAQGPFAVDVLKRPESNPWNCRLRLTGLDFLPGGQTAVVTAWDGSVWSVSGFDVQDVATGPSAEPPTLRWRRIASGLFQPLGVKVVAGQIYVICRDQLVRLHDLNQDGEMDWFENFNSDHQVTEHFHEFAAGLQVDEEGNFYYAKCARHAKPALVPQHGTLLRVSADGRHTEILANGFRAPNGVCVNGDGTFWMTDQEGHWTPKNRLNLVRPGGFYGNFLGYHEGEDSSDDAMEQPAAWITNAFDRSPSEMMWVPDSAWKPLQGALLNFSYGYGQIYVVLTEEVQGQVQGGMVPLPLDRFPTGIMRGRFHPGDGQLYCCGMFAWAGNQQQPGGLYRVRYTGGPVHLPVKLEALAEGVQLTFSDPLDPASAGDSRNYLVRAWDLQRSANYGSQHLNERELEITAAEVSADGRTVRLRIPGIAATRGMEIRYSIQAADGSRLNNAIHNTIHHLPK